MFNPLKFFDVYFFLIGVRVVRVGNVVNGNNFNIFGYANIL
jgi:hypothetical protein